MDIFAVIGAGAGSISLLVSVLVAIFNGRKDFKAEIKSEMQEVAEIKTKTAVLEERIANQGALIQTAIEKLDEIRDQL